jgi:hypothetical protein
LQNPDDLVIGLFVVLLFVLAVYYLPSIVLKIIFYSTLTVWTAEIAIIGAVILYFVLKKGRKTKS